MAVEARTLSWLGIGWRPRRLTAACRNAFPTLAARPQVDAEFAAFVEQQRRQPLAPVRSKQICCSIVDEYSTPRLEEF